MNFCNNTLIQQTQKEAQFLWRKLPDFPMIPGSVCTHWSLSWYLARLWLLDLTSDTWYWPMVNCQALQLNLRCSQNCSSIWLFDASKNLVSSHTPPEWAIQQPVVSREVVYYIMSGTPRGVQKYFCPNLTADFFGDNNFFLICDQITNQTSQLIGFVDSW